MRDLLCRISDTLRDLSLGDWLGIATLALVIVSLYLTIRWHRRQGRAELVLDVQLWHDGKRESHRVYSNPNAPAGWQVTVCVRNRGAAPAREPAIWIVDSHGRSLTHRFRGYGETIESGAARRLGADLPEPPNGSLQAWVGWEDARGQQEWDTGIRI